MNCGIFKQRYLLVVSGWGGDGGASTTLPHKVLGKGAAVCKTFKWGVGGWGAD